MAALGQLHPDTPGPAPLPADFWPRLREAPALAADRVQRSGYAGYALECLETAAACVLQGDSLEDVLIRTANLGGESDTIGAVAGGAAGAHWGRSAIPERWLRALRQRERVEAAAQGLLRVRTQDRGNRSVGAPPRVLTPSDEDAWVSHGPWGPGPRDDKDHWSTITLIPDDRLTEADVPPRGSSWARVFAFALTFDGMRELHRWGRLANDVAERWRETATLPSSLTELRGCLFFEQRRWRHFGDLPGAMDAAYFAALVDAIRRCTLAVRG